MSKSLSGLPSGLGPTTSGIPTKLRKNSVRLAKRVVSATAKPSEDFSFRAKPVDIVRHLDRFVIGQTEAKKALAVALCDHFQHVRLTMEGREAPFYQKQNVLLLGPTGVGKTHLIRSAAELIGVPFVKADATKFSETGYVGGDVDDLVRDLVRRAGGDVKKASHGIIYLDEVDKLATHGSGGGRDVSGRGVQTNLLKLMEDGDVPLISPNDVNAQIQSAMASARGSSPGGPDSLSTRHILFIASGAFSGIEDVIRQRLEKSKQSATASEKLASTADLTTYGLEPEFVGRLPVRVACHRLDTEDLFHVLRKSESSLIHQYERSFGAYGIRLKFRDDGLRALAVLASEERTGARGLMTVMERVFRDLKYRLPSTSVKAVTVDAALVKDPRAALKKLVR